MGAAAEPWNTNEPPAFIGGEITDLDALARQIQAQREQTRQKDAERPHPS